MKLTEKHKEYWHRNLNLTLVLLAISLWMEERNVEQAPAQADTPPAEPSTDLV